ncbi:LCP family protein [Streptomyces sp. RPT161]|uniref:LCP family protein n=1 Tax=Streptomyces sp. RPT161 TaxID=3015993 RepID=UPI0022B90316|nr:LCP family protein [Streptomyces sp. RPT161]
MSGDQEHYGQDPYAGGYQQGQQGYDPYAPAQQGYDQAYHQGQQPYAPYPDQQQYPQQGYVQQPYPQEYPQQGYPGHDGYQTYQQPGYQDPAAYPQPSYEEQRYQVPQPRQEEPPRVPEPEPQQPPIRDEEAPREFHTEQFAFVEDEDEQAEDVIDWLKFSESRTERRDERKRRGRTRVVVLVVLLVLALLGGVGYLWQAGKLPGLGKASAAAQAAGAQKRDVIVVHLRQVDSNASSTALLVGNETTGKGTTVLLPNSLSVNPDGNGSTTLGKSVVDQGAGPTRDALNALLGANIQGSWRLDTPYLEILVDAVGDITVDTDTTITSGGKTVVNAGQQQDLNGQAAVAYASYRGPGESQDKQLNRFGQVMQAVLMKLPSDAATATKIIDSLGAIPDPSLSDAQLGATLAHLADQEKAGHYSTTTLPVQADGTLSQQATDTVVKDVLGGTVKNTDTSGIPRVAVRDATGSKKAASSAQVAVVNSGYTYVDGGTASPQARSQVVYGADSQAQTAKELAKTLGLPDSAVSKGQAANNADITVVLGGDYKG